MALGRLSFFSREVDPDLCLGWLLMKFYTMIKIYTLVVLGLLMINSLEASVIPHPNKMEKGTGEFVFTTKTKWIVQTDEQGELLEDLFEQFRIVADYKYDYSLGKKSGKNALLFKTDSHLPEEGYRINIEKDGIVIEYANTKGMFYAIQTLKQLLPVSFSEKRLSSSTVWKVPALTIEDAPRFGYRGFMLDVSRYFTPKEHLLRIIDYIAIHKINYLHLHLVDDNGWRIQIKKYPELTDVGAWRVGREAFFSMRPNAIDGEPVTVGGYYTQEDIKEILAHAHSKFIEVIPEIEMPAHTASSLAAFPHLTCLGHDEPINVLPGIGGSKASVIYCPGNDEVFDFLEDVLDEVIDLFPSEYIHIGGDEAWKENWAKCPRCKKRMEEEGFDDVEELQGYFIGRIDKYLKKKGKKMMGWDELVDNPMPEGATIFGWRGMGESALKAVDLGHKVIMTPARKLYLIRYQGPQWFEPYTYFGNTTLQDVYDYDPAQMMNSGQMKLVKGIQASLWTEFSSSPQDIEYLIFPRLAAFSESAWTLPENKDWSRFLTTLDELTETYKELGINYSSKSMFNLSHSIKSQDRNLMLTLSSIRPDVEIRYTLNGTEPTLSSSLYTKEFKVERGEIPRAAGFMNGELKSDILTLNMRFNKATGKEVISVLPNKDVLTNGLLGSEKMTDGEYVDLYNTDGEFLLDLGQNTTLKTLKLSFLNNSGGNMHLPTGIKISHSSNNDEFSLVEDWSQSTESAFASGLFKSLVTIDLTGIITRFLKIELKNPGLAPGGHTREGTPSRIAFDEIIVL